MTSKHLEDLISKQHGSTTMQVVFVDIVSYSKRKSTVQRTLIDEFTRVVNEGLHAIGQKYLQYSQSHDANFANDIIKIPTGDGIAVVFTFEGLQLLSLDFVEYLLEAIFRHNTSLPCERFDINGWCNCHSCFRVRVGVSEGKGIVFKDVNGLYNVAGSTINLAARVMGLADGGQVFFTKDAFRNLVDMTTDTTLEERFREYSNVKIKHGVKVDVHQYCPSEKPYINATEPEELLLRREMESISSQMWPGMGAGLEGLDPKAMNQVAREMLGLQTKMVDLLKGPLKDMSKLPFKKLTEIE
jgi:class 3 adenylate cyclase